MLSGELINNTANKATTQLFHSKERLNYEKQKFKTGKQKEKII